MKPTSPVLRNWCRMMSLAAALAIVLADVALATGQSAAVRPTPASAEGAGPQEGIKVHGQWVLEVRNPDGTLAERRDFQNAYVGTLQAFLGRGVTPGPWWILLDDATATNPQACLRGGAAAGCALLEGPAGPDFSLVTAAIASTALRVTAEDQPIRLLLSGSFTAAAAANITRVRTFISMCAGDTSPASCGLGATNNTFSGTTAFAPVAVVPGRIVQVTVTFTFS